MFFWEKDFEIPRHVYTPENPGRTHPTLQGAPWDTLPQFYYTSHLISTLRDRLYKSGACTPYAIGRVREISGEYIVFLDREFTEAQSDIIFKPRLSETGIFQAKPKVSDSKVLHLCGEHNTGNEKYRKSSKNCP